MIEKILFTVFFIQVLLFILKPDKNFNTFLIWSLIVNIFFFTLLELEIPSYLKGHYNFPKSITYSTILIVLLAYYKVLKSLSSKTIKAIFLLALFFWSISILVEYIGKLGIMYVPKQEFVEDIFLYVGMLIWLYLFLFIFVVKLKTSQQIY